MQVLSEEECEWRCLESDRKVIYDAFLDKIVFKTVESKRKNFWKVFAFHAVAQANRQSSSSLILGAQVSEVVDQLSTNMITKWLMEVCKDEEIQSALSINPAIFIETAFRLLEAPFNARLHLTPYGGVFLSRVALFVLETFSGDSKRICKPEEAELFLEFLTEQSKTSADKRELKFLDKLPGALLLLCYNAKWLMISNKLDKFFLLISNCGIFDQGRMNKEKFVEAMLEIELHRFSDPESLLAAASIGFDGETENCALKELLKAVQEHRSTEECLSALSSPRINKDQGVHSGISFANWAENFLSISILTSEIDSLKQGVSKPLAELHQLVKKLNAVSNFNEDVLAIIRQAVTKSVNENFDSNVASSASAENSLLSILQFDGFLTPEYALEFVSNTASGSIIAQKILSNEQIFQIIVHQIQLVPAGSENQLSKVLDGLIQCCCQRNSETVCKVAAKILVASSSTEWFFQQVLESARRILQQSNVSSEFIGSNLADATNDKLAELFFETLLQRLDGEICKSTEIQIIRYFKESDSCDLIDNFRSRPFYLIMDKVLESLMLELQNDEKKANQISLLCKILSMRHTWCWLLSEYCPEDLRESVRKKHATTTELVAQLAKRIREKQLTPRELHELENIFERFDSENLGKSSCCDIFDDLLRAFGVESNSNVSDLMKASRTTVESWKEKLNQVEIVLNFLSQVSEPSSGLNITVTDLKIRRGKFEELRNSFEESEIICDMDKEDPLGKIFRVKSFENMSRAKNLIQSHIFRSTFLETDASEVGDSQPNSSAQFLKHPKPISCTEILENHLPKAVKSYKQFWSKLRSPREKLQQIEKHIREPEIDLKFEITTAQNFLDSFRREVSLNGLDLLENIKTRSMWKDRLESLHYFVHKSSQGRKGDRQLRNFDSEILCCEECRAFTKQTDQATNVMVSFLQQTDPTIQQYMDLYRKELSRFNSFDANIWQVLKKLQYCNDVVKFLFEQKDSDLQQLMDSTDDSASNDVSPSVINSLISLQKALKQFLQTLSCLPCEAASLINSLSQALGYFRSPAANMLSDSCAKNLIDRIGECHSDINAIKKLHASLGSRGTTSKDLASVFVRNKDTAEYAIHVDQLGQSKCYLINVKDSKRYSLLELVEHRSRIFLSKSNQIESPGTDDHDSGNLRQFIIYVDLIESALETVQKLNAKGYPLFFNYEISGRLVHLGEFVRELKSTEVSWDALLTSLRNEYSLANWILGPGLMRLFHHFFGCGDGQNVRNVLYYMRIDESILKCTGLKAKHHVDADALRKLSHEEQNSTLSKMLREIFEQLETATKLKPRNLARLTRFGTDDMRIQPGKLVIYQMPPNDKALLSAFLNVCISNQEEAPWISELIFCNQQSTSEEVVLAVRRASDVPERVIFILDAQELNQNALYDLITELSSLSFSRNQGRVAIFCRATESHLLFTVFGNCIAKLRAPSNEKLNCIIRECLSEIFFCTSDRPSAGKSEKIVAHIFRNQPSPIQVHISGCLCKEELALKLENSMKGLDHGALHFDIGMVKNIEHLEAILFEMSLCNAISTSKGVIALQPRKVYLEIANTTNDELLDSFSIFSRLSDSNCHWENLQNMIVSSEPMSHIQILCKYLNLVNENAVDDREISLVEVLSQQKCIKLLVEFFSRPLENGKKPIDFTSFLGLEICTKILGEQLKRFTASSYFSIRSIGLSGRSGTRSRMVNLILHSTLQLSFKSVSSIKAKQADPITLENEGENSHLTGLICWEKFAHVFPVFMNRDASTVELIFQNYCDVQPEIMELFQSASSKKLVEFNSMSEAELQEKLVKIVAHSKVKLPENLAISYVLTADNFVKMVLINLRIDADVPVVLIGETGCGKTSLVRYLAAIKNCELRVMNFHAGITEADIVSSISDAENFAYDCIKKFANSPNSEGLVVVFLDEVNTCEHLGLLKDIICHKRLKNRQLPCNLRFIVACNPYVLRSGCSQPVGLEIKELIDDKLARLVYRVNPLPESMLELVWDFGRLTENDELTYVHRMVSELFHRIPDIPLKKMVASLSVAQNFIRNLDGVEFTVSLRDVRRFCEFFTFFSEYFGRKEGVEQSSKKIESSWLFALYICYYVRITDSKIRRKLLERLSEHIGLTEDEMIKRFETEELDLLNRMTIPSKTAKNLALLENIFVVFSCIYCQIPVFLIGKPGCSKSLALNIIRSNLRGEDSDDTLLRQYPPLRFFNYQGSETSTSDGIIKVFKKAEKCKLEGASNFQHVVLIDEIGLAEKSRYNPLKVLHGLLEPESSLDCKSKVSVVGISNWALDPAKMNRAIYISRPEMNEEELYSTGKAICSAKRQKTSSTIDDSVLRGIARASYQNFKTQSPENFHGLRDYYYLLKYICDHGEKGVPILDVIHEGILRNFNGNSQLLKSVVRQFQSVFQDFKPIEEPSFLSGLYNSKMERLILQNLSEPEARHLMLVCDGEFCLDLLCSILRQSERSFQILHGSLFDKDQFSDEFSYRKLNEVMSCMEQGTTLILKDFDLIYGSLYDMLNQNYSEYSGRRYCRVAMGTQSNQNCAVHNDFRCIVLITKEGVRKLDPPFLNRFEKQLLCFQDKLKLVDQLEAKKDIEKRLEKLCEARNASLYRKIRLYDTIQGYDEQLIATYILDELKNAKTISRIALVRKVLYRTLEHMFPDAVLRISYSEQIESVPSQELQQHYFNDCLLRDLSEAIKRTKNRPETVKRVFIYTRFSSHRAIELLQVSSEFQVTERRLIDFRQENDLIAALASFLKSPAKGLLLIKTKPSIDGDHVLHTRCLIDSICDSHSCHISSKKVIAIIVHIQQEDLEPNVCSSWKWNPLMPSWSMFCVEELNTNSSLDFRLLAMDSAKVLANNGDFLQLVHEEAVPKSLSEALRHSELHQTVSLALRQHLSVKNMLIRFITEEYLKPVLSEKGVFHQDNWISRLSLETIQLVNFASFTEFLVSSLKKKYGKHLTEILKIMDEFGLLGFLEDYSCDVTVKALPLVLHQIISYPNFTKVSRVQCLKKLKYPISPFLFDFGCRIFQKNFNKKQLFLKEFKNILCEVFSGEAVSIDGDAFDDFLCLLSYHISGVDRSDSLRQIMRKQINQCSSLDEAFFIIMSAARKYEESFSDLLNVCHHVQSITAEPAKQKALAISSNICCDFGNASERTNCLSKALNDMLGLLLPEEETYSHLQITSLSEWRRVATSCLGSMKQRNRDLSCVPQLEALLRFFCLFVSSVDDRAIWQAMESGQNYRDASGTDTYAQLQLWKSLATNVLKKSEVDAAGSKSEKLLSLVEVSFYHSLLSISDLDRKLLEDIINKISEGCLPIRFANIVWEKLIRLHQDLLEDFEDIVTQAPKNIINSIYFNLLESFRDCQNDMNEAADAIEFMKDISPDVSCIAQMEFSQLISLRDTLQFFYKSVQNSLLLSDDFQCFGKSQEDILSCLNQLVRKNPRHPVWLAFLRILRTRFTLGEIESIFKLECVPSYLNCLRKDVILSFGQEALFIANFSLRYPFVVCNDADFYMNVISSFRDAVTTSNFQKLEPLAQRLTQELNESRKRLVTADFVGAFVELFGLIKSERNLRSSEMRLSKFIKNILRPVMPSDQFRIIELLFSDCDSHAQCMNMTSQCTSNSVCLITLYQTCLLQILAREVNTNSVIYFIKNMLLTGETNFEKLFPAPVNSIKSVLIRRCSLCNSVSVYQRVPDDKIINYPCQYCDFDRSSDLQQENIEFSNSHMTQCLQLILKFACCVYATALVDLSSEGTRDQRTVSSFDLEGLFYNLCTCLNLPWEDSTWLLHAILTGDAQSINPFFDQSPEMLMRYVAKNVMQKFTRIREFKRRRLDERQVEDTQKSSDPFEYARLVDSVDDSEYGEEASRLQQPGGMREVKLLFDCESSCMQSDQPNGAGWLRLAGLLLRSADAFNRMLLATHLIRYHKLLTEFIDIVHDVNAEEIFKADERKINLFKAAKKAWQLLSKGGERTRVVCPYASDHRASQGLLTESSHALRLVRDAVEEVNQVLLSAACLRLQDGIPVELPVSVISDCECSSVCMIGEVDVINRPDDIPACSIDEFNDLVRLACQRLPPAFDCQPDWDLLTSLLSRRLFSGGRANFGRANAWEPPLSPSAGLGSSSPESLDEAAMDDLARNFETVMKSTKLTETDVADFERKCREDAGHAARIAEICCTALTFVRRRIELTKGQSIEQLTLAEYMHRLGVMGTECVGKVLLNQTLSLLEEAEQALFAQSRIKMREALVCATDCYSSSNASDMNAMATAASKAKMMLSTVPKADRPSVLRRLRSACVRRLLHVSINEQKQSRSVQQQLTGSSPAVELTDRELFELCDLLHQQETEQASRRLKFNKLLSRY